MTDLLLNPRRTHGVSFGHVRWYGLDGQLLFAATGEEAGEQSGHLIFYFSVGHAYYDVSLHAWAAKERLRGRHVHRVDTDGQAGAALPHVIATLKAVVRSIALAR